jgi:predicted outer membrane lipoprotein
MPDAQAGALPSTLVIPGLEKSRPGAQSSAPIDPYGPTAPRTPSSSGASASAHGSWPGHVGSGTVALNPQWPAGGGSSPGAPQWPAAGGSSPGQSAPQWHALGGQAPGSWPGAQSWPSGSSNPAQPLWPGEDPFAQPPKRSGLWHLAWIAPLGVVLLAATAFGVVKALEASEDDDDVSTRAAATGPRTTSAEDVPPPPPIGVMLPVQQPAAAPVAPSPPPVPPVPVGTTSPPTAGTEPPRAHACVGTWQGSLYQSDGQTGTSVVSMESASGPCGSFVERWASGSVCHYRLLSCSTDGNVLSASARTPSYEQCSPVRVRFTCEGGRMRFHESAPGVTVTSTMSRR